MCGLSDKSDIAKCMYHTRKKNINIFVKSDIVVD